MNKSMPSLFGRVFSRLRRLGNRRISNLACCLFWAIAPFQGGCVSNLCYDGDIQSLQNLHGLNEADVYINHEDTAYNFYPELGVLASDSQQFTLEIADHLQVENSGLIFILRCSVPNSPTTTFFARGWDGLIHQCSVPNFPTTTFSTTDQTLHAWLVRNFEYPLSVENNEPPAAYRQPVTDYKPILDSVNLPDTPLLPGVYPLTGTIEIRFDKSSPDPSQIAFLKLRLASVKPMPIDEKWLSASELINTQGLANTQFDSLKKCTLRMQNSWPNSEKNSPMRFPPPRSSVVNLMYGGT